MSRNYLVEMALLGCLVVAIGFSAGLGATATLGLYALAVGTHLALRGAL